MAAATRKRPVPADGTDAAAVTASRKRARITFRSIHDYKKLEVLGEGSYGVVVKARHLGTGEAVAVKWAKAAAGHRHVLREAGCLAACRGHPSVVEIKDVVADAATGDAFLVMEFVAGATLRRRLTRRFPEAETRGFMRQLLRGAERMHGAGIVHRDIKPENILIGPGGAVKICDLGLARPVRPPGTPYPELRVGTLLYRSPEQLTGQRDYGTAVDMWALGCVMAELLTGALLFDEETEDDMLTRALDLRNELSERGLQAFDELPAFQGVPELSWEAREVLAGLLAFHPDDRLTATAALQHRWFAEEAERPASCRRLGRPPRSESTCVVMVRACGLDGFL